MFLYVKQRICTSCLSTADSVYRDLEAVLDPKTLPQPLVKMQRGKCEKQCPQIHIVPSSSSTSLNYCLIRALTCQVGMWVNLASGIVAVV